MTSAARDASESAGDFQQWLEEAHNGSKEALGRVLEVCRPFLLLVANQQLDPGLRAKVGASDLVQETFLEAQRDFHQFHGRTEEELLAWLRRVLLNNVADFSRQYATDKRHVQREVALAKAVPGGQAESLPDEADTPGAQARAREEGERLQRALNQLPEDYRQVIELRNYERCSYEEIGQRMGRSAEAVRKLWARAVVQLQQLLETPDESR
jgi:RNA polymerase sigma-70 factor (ECF subfamily)